LLDALDESPTQSQQELRKYISEFCDKYYRNRIIITSRTQTETYKLPTFTYVEITAFNGNQIECFVKNWFNALSDESEQEKRLSEILLKQLKQPENIKIAELSTNPMLLGMLCWVFRDLGKLPQKRAELFERGIDLLLQTWDVERGIQRGLMDDIYCHLSTRDRKLLLGYIAAQKEEREQKIYFERRELQQYISNYLDVSIESSLKILSEIEIQHGLLIERAKGIYSFSHLAFQEYFLEWFKDQN
jgi:predicted NACHT family NTPase